MVLMDEELDLTDLISVHTLQKMQDAFSMMTGIASLMTDMNGVAVTEGTIFSDFCMKYVRSTEIGRKRCELCDLMGAKKARRVGVSCPYVCHAGLVDFAAPIMAGGRMVGGFIGGQVLLEAPDEKRMRKVAKEIGVNPEKLIAAARKIRVIDQATIENATVALYTIANILSEIAYNEHKVYLKNLELMKASNMKSDFLANMSHEIRTPMNAVIGMAEMALREELSPAARNYVSQIKSSGQTLLTIINDILDFSKIESGKLDISNADYEPMSLINDVTNMIITRIGDKKLELIIDVNPNLPLELYGDCVRIKQVMVNLANNAVKFTKKGFVRMKVDYWSAGGEMIEMQVAVTDTGSGIKKQDMKKLFKSFQQVDSKRNRNIEGTGLGLAISKQLISLMGGKIHVDSEYGKGSTFSFVIPQKIVNRTPSIEKIPEGIVAAGLFQNDYVAEEVENDMTRFGVDYGRIQSEQDLFRLKERDVKYLFIEQPLFSNAVENFLSVNQNIIGVLLVNFHSSRPCELSNVWVVNKPVYALNLANILLGRDICDSFEQMETDVFDFTAPEAEILVVDDNPVNLTVVEGLLAPLNMKVETALSGKEAVGKVTDKRYDIIFMDHMMPEVDGVETTRVIRRLLGENGQVPIIALTANAVEGTKEMFISEGMNDFVAKPIEMGVIISKLKKWLPQEKIHRQNNKNKDSAQAAVYKDNKPDQITGISIAGLDVQAAMQLLGNEKLFWSVVKEYYRIIDKKCALIREYEQKEQWKEYTVEVHALKSASRQIGAMELATVAARMEAAGNAQDAALIHGTTPGMLDEYMRYKYILQPYFTEESVEQGDAQINSEELTAFFAQMEEAMGNLDMDAMEEVIKSMSHYSYSEEQKDCFENLKNAVEDIDTERCEDILQAWKLKL